MNRFRLLFVLLISLPALGNPSIWQKSYNLEYEKKYNLAVEELRKLQATELKNEFYWLRIGWLNYLSGNQSASLQAYQKAIKLNALSIEAKLGLSLPLLSQNRCQEVTTLSKQILKIAPYQYQAHVNLMYCEQYTKRWTKLIQHANLLHQRYPADASILVYLARAYAGSQQVKKAKETYYRVLLRIPNHIEASEYVHRK